MTAEPGTRTTAQARLPPAEPMRRMWFRERVSPSLWFVPGLFVIGSYVLSEVAIAIDRARDVTDAPSWLPGADPSAASAFTAAVGAAVLSFAAVVFTTTLVAIQLAGGQYSPRVVRVFVRSRLTHVTLGLFLATFVFAVNALGEIGGDDDPTIHTLTVTSIYLLLAATLTAFILFVHGMSQMLRVQYLLRHITVEGRAVMTAAFDQDGTGGVEVDVPPLGDGPMLLNERRVGVVQAVDHSGLVALARKHDSVLEVLVASGEYVGVGTPVARVVSGSGLDLTGDAVTACFLLGAERTLVHDPGFVLRQLVDVAIRALSPAVNDPTTAVQVIDRINDLLGDVAGRPDPSGWYADVEGEARVHLPEPGLERLVLLGYTEIIRYGADSPQVVRRLRAALDVLEPLLRPDVQSAVRTLRSVLERSVADLLPGAFVDLAARPDRRGLG